MKNRLNYSLDIKRKYVKIVCFLSIISIFSVLAVYDQVIVFEDSIKLIDPQSSAVPTAPGPLLGSTWAVNTYSSLSGIDIGFTNSSGHLGYSHVFDSVSNTEPNGWINLYENYTYKSGLTTGVYYLHVKANNTDGCSATTHYGPWYVDQSLPTNPSSGSSSSHSDATWSNNASITYSWSGAGDTGGSGINGYAVRMETFDPGDINSFTTSSTSHIKVVASSGQYKVYIRTQDNANNWASGKYTSSETYYIDLLNPDSTSLSTKNVTSSWYNYALHVNYSWFAPSDSGGSGLDGYSYSFTQNSGDIPDETKDLEENQLWVVSSLLTQGIWYFHIRAKDNAGNWGLTSHSSAINIDTSNPTNPSIDVCSHPDDGTWSASSAFSINWTGAGDTGGSGLRGYRYVLDNMDNTDVTSSHTFTTNILVETTLTSANVYYFHVRAEDYAGNLAGSTIHYGPIKYDNTAPTNPTLFYPDVSTSDWTSIRDFFIYWEGFSDGYGRGVEGFKIIWDTNQNTEVEASGSLDTLVNSTDAPNLYQSNNWYIHVRTRDLMGLWAVDTVHYGPFYIDTFAPTNPTNFYDTPDTSVWSNLSEFIAFWSGEADVGGSLPAGFSYVFDTSEGTIPDATIDSTEASFSTDSILDGIYYFHLRTIDGVGNVSINTLHYGPYYFDATAPNNPLEDSLTCTSGQSITTWSTNPVLTIQWSEAWDYHSWIAGYSYIFSTNSLAIPDITIDSNNTQVSSGSLADSNSWYFIIRTRDNAGNWNTTTVTIGPFWIDSNAPTWNIPTLSYTNMTPGSNWYDDHHVEIEWSGASDPTGGSGIYGYGILWSQIYSERPAEVVLTTEASNISFYLANSIGWYVHIIIQDYAGLWSISSYIVGPWKIDNAEPSRNPTVSSTSHSPSDWSADATIDFTWSNAFDPISDIQGYSYVFDQTEGTIPDTNIDTITNGWSSGALTSANNYYFHIICCDVAGNWNMTVKTIGPFWIDVDKPTNPTTNVSCNPLVAVYSSDDIIDVQWSGATDSHSGLYRYYYQWVPTPSQPDLADSYQGGNSLTSGALGQGTWFFCVRTMDAVNNLADGYYFIGPFQIDKTAPNALLETALTANHTENAWVIGESDHPFIRVTWTAGTDVGGSGVAGYSYELNTEEFDNPDTVVDTSELEFDSSLLADSSTGWYFHIRVIDNVGHYSSVTHIGPFKIDTTAPSTIALPTSDRGDDRDDWNYNSFNEYVHVTLSGLYGGASDAGSGIDGFAYSFSMSNLDEAPLVKNAEETKINFDSSQLSITGRYWFHIRTFDNLGLYSTTYHFGNWTIDVTPPNNPLNYGSSTHSVGVWDADTTLTVSLSGAFDLGVGDFEYQIFIDNNPTAIGIPIESNWFNKGSYTNSSIGQGTFYIHLMTADKYGGSGPMQWNGTWLNIGPFRIDNTNPTNPTSVNPSQEVNVWGSSPSITISMIGATDSVSGIAGYSFLWTKNPLTSPPTDGIDGTSYLNNSVEEGIYYLNIKARDAAGNWAPGFYSSGPYKFDFGAPISSHSLSRSPESNGWYYYYVDIDFDNETYDISGLEGLYYRINEGSWILITNLDQSVRLYDGIHEIDYYLKDNAGNEEVVKSFQVQIDTNVPQVTTSLISIPNGGQIRYESGTFEISIDLSGEWNIKEVVMRIYNASLLLDTIVLTEGIGGEFIFEINAVALGFGDYSFDLNVSSTSGRYTFIPDAGTFSIISIPNADIIIYIILAVVGGAVAFAVYKVMTKRKPIKIQGPTTSPQQIREQDKITAISSALKQQKLSKLISYVEHSNTNAVEKTVTDPAVTDSEKNDNALRQQSNQDVSEQTTKTIQDDNVWIDQEIPQNKPILKEISKSRVKQITVQKLDTNNLKAIYCPVCGHKEFIDLKPDSDMKCPKCGQVKGILFKCPSCQDYFTMTVPETLESEKFDIPCPSCNGAIIKPIKEDEI